MKLEKVYFYWLNREQTSFEWFVDLLSRIEAQDTQNLFDIHLYMTGAQKVSDMKSCTLFIAMDLMRSQTQVDMITGLKSPTKTGRPDWEAIFGSLADKHAAEDVDVYFCGPPDSPNNCDSFLTTPDSHTGKRIFSPGQWHKQRVKDFEFYRQFSSAVFDRELNSFYT